MRSTLRLCAVLGALAVALGAFGAHGLKSLVGPDQLLTFGTGVRYHFYHTLAIGLAAGLWVVPGVDRGRLRWAVRAWAAGVVLFSGSLYLLALAEVLPVAVRWLGPVTPLGGVFFIGGWVMLFAAAGRTLATDA